GTQLPEGEHVRVHAAPSDLVAARPGKHGLTLASEEGGRQQEGAADARGEGEVRRRAGEPGRVDAHRSVAHADDLCPRPRTGLEQGLDVANLREVVEDDRPRHEERRGDDGEGLVLVPSGPERALDGTAPSTLSRSPLGGSMKSGMRLCYPQSGFSAVNN